MADLFEQIEELSKAEILELIRAKSLHLFQITERDVSEARYNVLVRSAQSLMGEALAESEHWLLRGGKRAMIKWLEAQLKFDQALNMHERADRLWAESHSQQVTG